MTWREYIAGLTPVERDIILYGLLSWQMDDCGIDGDIGFSEGEDPSYQGTFTVNAHLDRKSVV